MSRSRIGQLLAAFRYSDFRVLWISTVSNQLGQGMQQVLLGWLVFEITGSGAMVGAVFAARSAPNLVVGFLAGSITDRMDRRLLIRASILGMILVSGSMGILAITGNLPVAPRSRVHGPEREFLDRRAETARREMIRQETGS